MHQELFTLKCHTTQGNNLQYPQPKMSFCVYIYMVVLKKKPKMKINISCILRSAISSAYWGDGERVGCTLWHCSSSNFAVQKCAHKNRQGGQSPLYMCSATLQLFNDRELSGAGGVRAGLHFAFFGGVFSTELQNVNNFTIGKIAVSPKLLTSTCKYF